MAEHLRHEQARAGQPVRPRSNVTLANLLDKWAKSKPAPTPLLVHLVEQAISRLKLARFERVAGFRGFQVAVAQMLEEAPVRGPYGEGLRGEWAALMEEVEQGLVSRGTARRNV